MAIKISGNTIINDSRVVENADRIGIGTTNPYVALEISSGDVGIGTTNPTASNIKTSLQNNTNVLAVGIVTANEYYGTFKGTVDPVVAANRIQQGNTKAEVIDTNGDGHFKVTTEGTERLRINSVGNLLAGGITTSLSGFMFGSSTFGGEDGEMYLYKSAANAASLRITIDGPYVEFKDEDGDVQMGSAGSDLRLSANGDEKVRITSTGNVGIGTTRPFDSYGTASGGTGFEKRLEVVSGGAIPYLFSGGDFVDAEDVLSVTTKSDYGGFNINVRNQNEDNPLWTIRTFANEPIAFGQGLFEIARFDGNGNLGIGTTNPELPVTSGNTAKLAVGIVTAHELYGTLKGAIDPGVAITKANKINIQTNAENATKYLTFVSDTSGYEDVLVNTNITYNPNFEGRNIGKLTINGDVGIAGTLTVEDVTNVDSIGLITARTGVRITQDGLVVTAGVSTFGDHLIPSATDSYNIGEDPNVAGNNRWNKVYAAEYYGTFKGTIDPSVSDSKIKQGDTKAEVLDTGTDGRFVVTTDNVERLKINHTGLVQIGDRHNASTYNWDARLKVAIEQNTDSNGDQVNDPSAIHFGESVNNSANPAINFLRRDGATTWSAHVGQIHYGLDTDGNQAQMVFATALNNTPGNHSIQPRMFIKQTGYVGIATENIDDPIGTQNNTKLAVAGIVTALEYYGLFKGTIDTTVNSISLNTNLQDVFSVSGNQLSAKDVNADRIIFWDDNPGELTHLAVDSNTLEIDGTTLKVKASAVGKTYTLDAVDSGDNAILRLSDGTNNDDVTITAGTGITLDPVATGGFTIAANANAGKTYTLDAVDSGDNAILRLSDGTNNDDVTITAGSNITINPVAAGGFTIAAVQGAGLDLDSSVADVLDITSGTLSADDPDDDKIIFYDDSATKLTHLTVGTGLVINGTTLNIDNSVVGKSYTLPASGTDGSGGASGGSGSATLTLTGTDSTTDPVTVTAGSGIVIDNTTESGFRISADISEGGGGGLSDVQVKQFADNASPRTLRVSSLGDPIEVQKSVGIVTIGIGTTSNAYGNRFIQPSTPTGAVEGDIWFDTSTTGSGVNRVAILEDRKNNGVNGGNVGTVNVWFTRTLNHKTDPQGFIISFSGSVFVLEAGTYRIKFSAPGFHCEHFQSRITYSTAADFSSPNYIQGSSEFSDGGNNYFSNSQDRSHGEAVLTITDTTYFKLEQNVSYQQGVSDSNPVAYTTLGVPASRVGGEVYSQVLIEDLATAIKLESPNIIIQGDTKAEVLDTGTDGKFVVTTNGIERVVVDPNGYLLAKSDMRVRREGGVGGTQNNGAIYFGDSNNNYMFGEDKVEVLTFNSGGSNNFIVGEQITDTSGDTAYVKTWDSTTYKLTIHDRSGSFQDGETVTGQTSGASWVIASGGLTSSGSNLLSFGTNGSEKLRITDNGSVNIGGNYTQTTDKLQITGNVKINGTLTYEDVTNVNSVGIITAAGFHATGATFDSGTETDPTNVALMIEKDDYIYSNDSVNSKRKLFGKTTSGIIKIGQTPTTLISGVEILPGTDGYFGVNIDATERFRVSKDGTVGVVTTANADLYVDGTTTVKALNINTLGAGDGDLLSDGGPDGIFGIFNTTNSGKTIFPVKDSGGTYNDILELLNDRAIIDGDVGIGTTNPTAFNVRESLSTNDKVLAVGIITCHELYVNGTSNIGGGGSGFVLLSEKPSTSGTEVFFDNIPSDALEITLMFTGVSATGNNNFKIQLGTANGYITSGYDSLSQNEGGGDDVPATDCFLIKTGSSSGGGQYRTGSMVIKKASSTSYVQTGQFANTPQTERGGTQTYGSLSSVIGTVDRLKVILSGSDTFDAGAMSVSYKTQNSGGGSGSGGGGNVATSMQTFATAGTYTYTPTSGTTSIIVHVIGAGGATGSPNNFAWIGGGGAGGVAIRAYNLEQLGTSAAITVGAKGVGSGGQGSPQNGTGIDGAAGTDSSFNPGGTGVTITGGGGSGSPKGTGSSTFTDGGAGGTASNGNLNFTGEKGYKNRGIPDKWSYLNNSASSNYYIDSIRSKPAGGGYGQYGLGAPSVSIQDASSPYSNGYSGEDGAVIIYEYASSGSNSGSSSQTGTTKVAILRDEKNANVGSGTGANNTWIDRDITVKTDPHSFVTLNARVDGQTTQSTAARRSATNGISYFTLPAGTYKIKFRATGYYISQHQAAMVYSSTENTINKVYATTDNVTKIYGTSETSTNNTTTSDSTGTEIVTIDQTTYFKVIHYTVSTFGQSDFGQSGSPDKNVYLEIEVEDLKTAVKEVGTSRVAVLQDVRTQGTNGGTASTNNWHQRRLNSKIDSTNFVTILNGTTGRDGTGNTFSLGAGTYLLQWRAPGFDSGDQRAKIAYTTSENYNTLFSSQSSSGVSYLSGESAQSQTNYESNIFASGSATVTISQTTYFRLQHYVTSNDAGSTKALGEAGDINGEDEIYSQVIVEDLTTAIKNTGDDYVAGTTKVAVVKDQKNNGIDGGTFTQNAWRDRDLTVKDDPFNFVTLYPTTNGQANKSPGDDPGYFSLLPGKYKIKFRAPAFKTNQHMARMVWSSTESYINKTYATTDSFDGQSYGTSEFVNDSYGRVTSASEGVFVVEITQTSYFKVLHYGKDTESDNGFGEAANIGSDPETYTIVEIEDLATAVKGVGTSKVAVLQDVRSESINGGANETITAGAWHQRKLNSKYDTQDFVTFENGTTGKDGTNNIFSLPAGTYLLQWKAPGYNTGKMFARIAYTTSTNYVNLFSNNDSSLNHLDGETSEEHADNTGITNYATGSATITTTQTTYFALQHYISSVASFAPQTLGRNNDITGVNEIYSQVIIEDLETAVLADKIQEGNTSVETVDTGSNGHVKVTTEGTEQLRIYNNGIINMGRALTDDPVLASGNVNAGLKLLGATSSSTPGDGYGLVVNAKSIVGIFNRTHTTGRIVEFKNDASVVGAIESDANNILEILGENATKFKVGGEEKLRITSDGDAIIGQTVSSSSVLGGGIYTRTIDMTASGTPVNNQTYTVTKDFFTFDLANGAIAGTVYGAVNGNYLSASFVYHFAAAAGSGNVSMSNSAYKSVDTTTFDMSLSISQSGTYSNKHTLTVNATYKHNGNSTDPTIGGPRNPHVTLTVVLGAANIGLTVTRPTTGTG